MFEIDNNKIFKVNLPLTNEDFYRGVGEGVWACASIDDYEKMNNNVAGDYTVAVLNDSCYYPTLKYGDLVLCKFDGLNRPVAYRELLIFNFGENITVEEKKH